MSQNQVDDIVSTSLGPVGFSKGFTTPNAVLNTNATYTILPTDGYNVIEMTTGATAKTVTLPAVASSNGRQITIGKVDGGAGVVTITPNGGSINGNTNWQLSTVYSFVVLWCDGINWYVQGESSGAGWPGSVNVLTNANYTVLPYDGYSIFEFSTGASNRTLTLPAANASSGRIITVKKSDSGSGFVTVTPATGSIDQSSTYQLSAQWAWISIYSDGSNWFIIGLSPGVVNNINAADYTVTTSDGYSVIEVTTGAVNRTVTLPAVASSMGRILTINKVDTGVGLVVITPSTGLINSNSQWQLPNRFSYVQLYCDGANWYVQAQSLGAINNVSNANYAILPYDNYAEINVTTGALSRTITLPAVGSSYGRIITIKKVDNGVGVVTINTGSGNIEYGTSYVLTLQYNFVTLYCDGVNWFISAQSIGTVLTVASTTYTIGTYDSINEVNVSTGASNRTITLPLNTASFGRLITIKKTDSGAGSVVITPNGGNIDGNTGNVLLAQYSRVTLYCDGTNWSVQSVYDFVANSAALGNMPGVSGNYVTIVSFTLQAGTWLISGGAQFYRNGATVNSSQLTLGLSTTNNAAPNIIIGSGSPVRVDVQASSITASGWTVLGLTLPTINYTVTTSTTIYLIGATDVVTVGNIQYTANFTAVRVS